MSSRWPVYVSLMLSIAAAFAALEPRLRSPDMEDASKASTSQSTTASLQAAPRAAERPFLEPATRDPFASSTEAPAPPPAPVPPQRPPIAPQVIASVPVPPQLPTHNLRFAGRMTAPDGSIGIYALLGNEPILLKPGLLLSTGFRVDQIDTNAVRLTHVDSNTPAHLDIPPAPAFETR